MDEKSTLKSNIDQLIIHKFLQFIIPFLSIGNPLNYRLRLFQVT